MANLQLSDGTTVNGKYKIIATLGQGGGGTVYRALQLDLNRELVLKFLHFDLILDDESMQRFEREAKLLATLQDKHLPQIYSMEMLGQVPFIAMEIIDGSTLEKEIRDRESWSWRRTAFIALQLCEALELAHNEGIVHRDLKPANIMLQKQPHSDFVKIIDFGLARLVSNGAQKTLTATGFLLGTPTYMSPEMCTGEKQDKRADIYSLSCILYECLTGCPPFISDNALSLIYKHKNEDPIPLAESLALIRDAQNAKRSKSEIDADIEFARKIDAVVLKGLEKSPDKRFQSMKEFAEAIRSVGENSTVKFAPTHSPDKYDGHSGAKGAKSKHKNRVYIGASLCALLLLISIALNHLRIEGTKTSISEINKTSEAKKYLSETQRLIDDALAASKRGNSFAAKQLSRKALNIMYHELLLPRDQEALLSRELGVIRQFSSLGKYLVINEVDSVTGSKSTFIENMAIALKDNRNNIHSRAEYELLLAVAGEAINDDYADHFYGLSAADFAMNGETSTARQILKEAKVPEDKKKRSWHIRKAQMVLAFAEKDMKSFRRMAQEERNALLSAVPGSFPANWYDLAELYKSTGEYRDAKVCYTKYLEHPIFGPTQLLNAMFQLAKLDEKDKNYAQAIETYEKALVIAKDRSYFNTSGECKMHIARLKKLQAQKK